MNERKTPPSLSATKTGCCSGPDRDRTDRLFHAMEALYQMSYRPKYVPTKRNSLAMTRPTSRLSSVAKAIIFARVLATDA